MKVIFLRMSQYREKGGVKDVAPAMPGTTLFPKV